MDIHCRRLKAVFRRLFAALYFSRSPRQHDAKIVENGLKSQDKILLHHRMQEISLDAKTGLENTESQSHLVSPRDSARLLWLDVDYCEKCSICCEEVRSNDGNKKTSTIPVVRMSVCGHGFHTACIKAWMVSGRPSCPNCRSDQRKLMLRMGLATG